MPRVIQPGGGDVKMRMRYTARRKHGLVATKPPIPLVVAADVAVRHGAWL
jgi:hypothetical protein